MVILVSLLLGGGIFLEMCTYITSLIDRQVFVEVELWSELSWNKVHSSMEISLKTSNMYVQFTVK